jgi:DNA-binding transcriptional LysR family regulator
MELRHLRYFVAVAREGNFTRAAAALGIQQPPLSQQIRDLERELGFELFRRLPRGVALTPGGAVFRDEAVAILAQAGHAVLRGRQAASGAEGSLSVGFTSSAMSHRIAPELIRRFRLANPAVEVVIEEGNAERLSERVAGAQLDVGFIRRPVSERGNLEYHVLVDEPMLFALPVHHPIAQRALARRPPHVRLAELRDESFIFVRRPGAPGMYGDLVRACHKAGFAPNVVAEVGQMLTNITLVAAGVGISAVPASMRDIHREGVAYLEGRDAPRLRAPLNLMCRIGHGNPVIQRFVDFALKMAP